MELSMKLYYNSEIEKTWCDIPKILKLFDELQDLGVGCQIIDTVDMDEETLSELYIEAVMPSVRKHYRVKHFFGTRNKKGKFFGREQPALLVYKDNKRYPEDIYPHEEEREKVTIEDYLSQILADVEKQKPKG